LNATAGDWHLWDDTYYFLKGDNYAYVQDNLSDASVATLRLNMMIYLDNSGKIIYSKGFDPELVEIFTNMFLEKQLLNNVYN
jgi:sensor domain CHASE-containing protein